MKSTIITMMLCISAAACGDDSKPANDPSSVQTTGSPEDHSATSPMTTTTTVNTTHGTTTADSLPRSQNTTNANTSTTTPMADKRSVTEPQPVSPPPPPDTKAMDKTTTKVAGTDTPRAPDNTKVNERDRDKSALTPIDQGNGSSDIDITAKIRRAIVADNSFSMNAKNVKIITVKGKVTLRGPVNTPQERTWIEGIAKNVVGENVDNQLEIKK